MSSLIQSMIMGTPTIRRPQVSAATPCLLLLGFGLALSSGFDRSSLSWFGSALSAMAAVALWLIHQRMNLETARLQQSDESWHALMKGSLDSMMLVTPRQDLMGRFMGWEIRQANARAQDLYGQDAVTVMGLTLLDVMPERLYASLCPRLETARGSGQAQADEHTFHEDSGGMAPRWLHHQIIPTEGGLLLITRDTTEMHTAALKHATAQLRLSSRVIEETGDAVVVSDALDRIEMVNPAFLNMTGMSPTEVVGRSAELLGLSPLRESHLPGVTDALREGTRWSGESRQICVDGRTLDTWLSVSTLRNEQQRVTQHIRVFSDISVLKAQQRELVEQARHDSLTGLPNRRAFGERLHQAMARARRQPQTLAVLFVDLDGFKAVNDQLGHAAGDQVLMEVSRRLLSCVRLTDCVCRLAGDEFTVILEGAGNPGELIRICQRILDRLSQPHQLAGAPWSVTPSIGAAVYEAGESLDGLCERADAAMYAAKHQGKARFVIAQADEVHRGGRQGII